MKHSLLPLLLMLAAQPATAVNRVWDGGDASSNLSASLNWNPNAVPVAGDSFSFPAGPAAPDRVVNNNFPANTEFGAISFGGAGYTFGGTILKLTGGLAATAAGSTVFNGGVSFTEWSVVAAGDGTDFQFGAPSQIYGTPAGLSISAGNGGFVTFDGVLSVPGPVLFYGAGHARVHGAKGLSGDVTVALDLEMDHGQGLGSGGPAQINVQRTLRLLSAQPQTVAKRVRLGSNVGDPAELITGGAGHTFSGALELMGDNWNLVTVASGSLTLSGAMTSYPGSTGMLVKQGPGTLRVAGNAPNSFPGLFRAEDGLLELAKSTGPAMSGTDFQIGDSVGPAGSARAEVQMPGQFSPATRVAVWGDGALDLGPYDERVRELRLGSGASLEMDADGSLEVAESVLIAAPGGSGPATMNGTLRHGSGTHGWYFHDLGAANDLVAQVKLEAAGPGARIAFMETVPGDNAAEIYTETDMERITIADSVTIRGNINGPTTDFYVQAGILESDLDVRDLVVTDGIIDPAGGIDHETLRCDHLTMNGLALFRYSLQATPFLDHDTIEADLSVNLNHPLLTIITPVNQVYEPGMEFVMIKNWGQSPISGTFLNLPEGSEYLNHFRVSYQGWDGNDATLTWIIPPTGTTRVWDGGGADNKWTTAANWSGNIAPVPGDALLFPAVAQRKTNENDFPAGTSFQTISIGSGDYSVSGQPVYLNGDLSFQHASGTPVWAVPVEFTLPASVVSVTAGVAINAAIGMGNNDVQFRKGAGAGELAVNGSISGVVPGRFIADGTGTVRLTGANTFSGLTLVSSGRLVVSTGASLPGYVEVESAAELRLDGGGVPVILDNTLVIRGLLSVAPGAGAQNLGITGAHSDVSRIHTEAPFRQMSMLLGAGKLTKTGPSTLTLNYGMPLAGIVNGMQIDEGEVLLQMTEPDAFIISPVVIGSAGQAARLTLTGPDQIGPDVQVRMHPHGTFDAGAFADTFGSLEMTGGLVTGTSVAPLIVSTGHITTHAAAAPAVISARIGTKPGVTGKFTVTDGPATPDLSLQNRVYGELFEKHSAGRVDFTANQPVDALDKLDLQSGSAFFFSNSQFTAIALNGGTLGGHGTVGEIIADSGGIISPGASPGVLGGYKAVWNGGTTLRMELNGLSPGADYDQYSANSITDLGGANLELTTGFNPAPGDSFMIIRNVSGQPVSGTFAGIPQNGYVSAPGAKVFQINYTGGDGDDVMLTRIETVPPEIVTFTRSPGATPADPVQTHFVFQGTPGLLYWLQVSTDLKNWNNLQSAKADLPAGQIIIDIEEPAADPRKFYRLILP